MSDIMSQTSIKLIRPSEGEILKVGPLTLRIQEDGTTNGIDNRIAAITITIPPNTAGPPQHWHEMHDETFFVTKGTVRFSTDKDHTDAQVGDYVVVPPRSHHTFGNVSNKEAEMFCTLTPSFYIGYFRLLKKAFDEGPVSKEDYIEIMSRYATLPVRE